MKRTVIFTAIVLLGAYGFSFGQVKKSDLEKEDIVGNVRSIIHTVKDIKYNSETRDDYEYNTKGNITRDKHYWKGVYSSLETYEYDAKGFLISMKDQDTTGKVTMKEIYKNDAKGNRIELKYYGENNELYYIITYKFDPKGYLIEENKMDPVTKVVTSKTTYKIDDKGTIIDENTKLDYDAYWGSTHTITYNVKDLIEERNTSHQSNMVDGSDQISYTQNGYLYHDNGKQSYETFVSNDSNVFSSYDIHGNLVREERLYRDGEPGLMTYQYEYDAIGNWTKKSTFNNNVLTQEEERVINYYEL